MKKSQYLFLNLIFICICSLLIGCKHELDGLKELNESAKPMLTSIEVSEIIEPIGPEITLEPLETKEIVPNETIIKEWSNDIDHNGIMDLVQIIERKDGSHYIQVIFNGDYIFQHEWEDIRLLAIETFEYLDLDWDGDNEIFITVHPLVNSRPLIEVLSLKQSNTGWYRMHVPLNESGYNSFPFDISRGKEEFDFVISSQYTDKQIHFDASSFFVDDPLNNINSIQAYRKNNYQEGDKVAYISSWGIWEAKTGSYNGRNCIIALQGIESTYGNSVGRIIIYYAYDENGMPEILNYEYVS